MIGITASGECIMKYVNAGMFYCSRMKICTPVTHPEVFLLHKANPSKLFMSKVSQN